MYKLVMLCTDDGVATIGCDDVSTILVGLTEGILVSPKQPNLTVYPNDAICNWHIVVPSDMVCMYCADCVLRQYYRTTSRQQTIVICKLTEL